MNLNHQILIFAAMITVSLTADAEKVYESVDEKGVIEFSDKPSADAQVKDVETPNVADTLPVEHDEPSSSASVTTTKIEQTPEQLEVIHQGTADDYDNVEERVEKHEERKERIENIKEGVHQPSQLPAHKGVHRK